MIGQNIIFYAPDEKIGKSLEECEAFRVKLSDEILKRYPEASVHVSPREGHRRVSGFSTEENDNADAEVAEWLDKLIKRLA
jgi:hypothetical protein